MLLALRFIILIGFVAGVLLISAWNWRLPAFWSYLGLWCGFSVLFLLTIDRELQRERAGLGTKGEGQYLRAWLAPFGLGHLAVAGLDAGRYHWSGHVPLPVQVGGFVGFALSMAWIWWSAYVNRFFAPAILVQPERGHRVVSSGPYRFVRHPGYLGMALGLECSALALGSYWSILPAAGYVFLLVLRTAREDRVLHERMPGYVEYAGRV